MFSSITILSIVTFLKDQDDYETNDDCQAFAQYMKDNYQFVYGKAEGNDPKVSLSSILD